MLNVFQYLSTYTYLTFTVEKIWYLWIEYAYLIKLNYALNINIFVCILHVWEKQRIIETN